MSHKREEEAFGIAESLFACVVVGECVAVGDRGKCLATIEHAGLGVTLAENANVADNFALLALAVDTTFARNYQVCLGNCLLQTTQSCFSSAPETICAPRNSINAQPSPPAAPLPLLRWVALLDISTRWVANCSISATSAGVAPFCGA